MDKILTPKQRSAIKRCLDNPTLLPHLFEKAKGLHWIIGFKSGALWSPFGIPGPISGKKEGTYSLPQWPLARFLANNSKELLLPANEPYAHDVIKFIREATEHAKKHGISNYTVWWQFSKVMRDMPLELLKPEDIGMMDHWLDDRFDNGMSAEELGVGLLIRLMASDKSEDRKLGSSLISTLFKIICDTSSGFKLATQEHKIRFSGYHSEKILEAIIKDKCAVTEADLDVILCRLIELLRVSEADDYCAVWRPAVEEHVQNVRRSEALNLLVDTLRDLLLKYVDQKGVLSQEYVQKMLASDMWMTKRVAVHAIRSRYKVLSGLLDQVIASKHFEVNMRHEMWHFLTEHYGAFPVSIEKSVLDIIHAQSLKPDRDEPLDATYRALVWMTAIKSYAMAREAYDSYKKSGMRDPEHPDFPSYFSSGWVTHESPISLTVLLSLTTSRLVETLNAYDGPDGEGLSDAFRTVVKKQPLRYLDDTDDLVNLKQHYSHDFFEAFLKLWESAPEIEWNKIWPRLLEIAERTIRSSGFWINKDPIVAMNPTRDWLVSSISRLIEEGTKKDDRAFSPDLLDQAERITRFIWLHQQGWDFTSDKDAVSISINHPRGRCFEALLNVLLRQCRLADEEQRPLIWLRYEPTFSEELDRHGNGCYEFATLSVMYIANLIYLSSDWVYRNLDKLFDLSDDKKWLCSMQGYCYVSLIFPRVFEHLKQGGHFIKCLDDSRLSTAAHRVVVEHIAVAFLEDKELLSHKDSLISALIKRRKRNEITELIGAIWGMREVGEETQRRVEPHVLALMKAILSCIDLATHDGKVIASQLCKWTTYFSKIDDENRQFVYQVIRLAEEDWNGYGAMEFIARISIVQPMEAYGLWKELLSGCSAAYPNEAIETTLENILKMNPDGVRLAKDITSIYAEARNTEPHAYLKGLLHEK